MIIKGALEFSCLRNAYNSFPAHSLIISTIYQELRFCRYDNTCIFKILITESDQVATYNIPAKHGHTI